MKRKRTIVVGFAGVAAFALLLDLAEPRAIQAAVSTLVTIANTPNVNVVNTPAVSVANTVPVTGTVAVSNLPAVQLSGNVNVTNGTDAGGRPVVITDGSAPRNSFSTSAQCSSFGLGGCTATGLYTVPANDIAVIQSFSGECQLLASGDRLYDAGLVEPDGSNEFIGTVGAAVPVPAGIITPAVTAQTFLGNTTYYLPSGASVNGFADAVLENGAGSSGVCTFNVSGYLVHQ